MPDPTRKLITGNDVDSKEETEKLIKETTKKTRSTSKMGRPPKAPNRKHYNTMLLPEVKRKLKIAAAYEERTIADILEDLAIEYLKNKYPDLK